MSAPALVLRGFGVAFGDSVVLDGVDLELPAAGMTVLVGPVASGKSTLLRTLAGLNENHPSLRVWGVVEPTRPRPAMVVQHARFFLDSVRENLVSALPDRSELDRRAQVERVRARLADLRFAELGEHLERDVVSLPLSLQRRLAIVRAALSDAPVLFADEVDAGLEPEAANLVVSMLADLARSRSVVFVTHNQRNAQAAGGQITLLAGGEIHERATTADFFARPKTPTGRHFVRTGGAQVTGPRARTASESTPEASLETAHRPAEIGPRGFFWVAPETLGGTPRPGILRDLDDDLAGLRRLGIDRLVNLEESATVAPSALARHRIIGHHFPVVDMRVPRVVDAIELCRRVEEWIAAGDGVAFHCRAGLGRTGTMLACQLIWRGLRAREALDTVRNINHRCIQSDEQVEFLRTFELARADMAPSVI